MSIVEKALERLGKQAARESVAARAPEPGPAQRAAVEKAFLNHRAHPPRRPSARPARDLADTPPDRLLSLDIDRLRREGIIAPEEYAIQIADQYRRIKRPLLDAAFENDGLAFPGSNIILVSSAFSGDGKTFTALNLAFSMARELDRTVLLIDADVAKPHISELLGVRDRRGLIDMLISDEIDPGDVMLRTDYPGHLSLLPAGQRHSHATELLASKRMEEMTAQLSDRYSDRIIVIDSPPMLATTEAPVLASLAGQIVLVVQAGVTPQHAVAEAVARLEEDKALSFVLNKNQFGGGGEKYGYGGYYTSGAGNVD